MIIKLRKDRAIRSVPISRGWLPTDDLFKKPDDQRPNAWDVRVISREEFEWNKARQKRHDAAIERRRSVWWRRLLRWCRNEK